MWLKPHGYATITSPTPSVANTDGLQRHVICEGVNEFDTMTCGHCGRIVHIKARQRPEDIGGFCRACMRAICPTCVSHGGCAPLEKKLEAAENRERVLRSYGVI